MTPDEIKLFKDIIREEINQANQSLHKKIADFRNDILIKIDTVYKEVINMRQEQSAHQAKHDDIQGDLDEIKSIPIVAHELRKR